MGDDVIERVQAALRGLDRAKAEDLSYDEGVNGANLAADALAAVVPELISDVVQLRQFVSGVLLSSWQRLFDAHCSTIGNDGQPRWDHDWSIAAHSIADDIRDATGLVGPVDYSNIGMSLLTSGWFARAVERAGLSNQPVPDAAYLTRLRELTR